MKRLIIFFVIALSFFGCKNEKKVEKVLTEQDKIVRAIIGDLGI